MPGVLDRVQQPFQIIEPMMARRGRGASRSSRRIVAISRTPTPKDEGSDAEMPDAPSEGVSAPEEAAEDPEDPEAEEDIDQVATPGSALSEGISRRRKNTPPSVPLRRRPGRPPKQRPVDWDASDQDLRGASDVPTPKRRGGFRGGRGFGAGRWKKRAGIERPSQVTIDDDGTVADVDGDEIVLAQDVDGETKVDKNGYLQDGREYRVRTFTISDKGDKLFMLSTEPARCIGFRDSYLFFQKHRRLFKVILSDEAKLDLIERELMPHSYKGRTIGVVTARSVFREFGAKIVIGGRKIMDDYLVAEARANGDEEGEPAVPEDVLPRSGVEYDRNRYVAWHGASAVYHSAPTAPTTLGAKNVEPKKRKITVTGDNWMLEHARATGYLYHVSATADVRQLIYYRTYNEKLTALRLQNLNGVYEIHSNMMHLPKIMQPSHVRWEHVPLEVSSAGPDSSITIDEPRLSNRTAIAARTALNTPLSRVPPFQFRNLATIDTVYRSPPVSGLGLPGPDGGLMDVGPPGLVDVEEDVLAELPEECRAAFFAAQEQEATWKNWWGTEKEHGLRAKLRLPYAQS